MKDRFNQILNLSNEITTGILFVLMFVTVLGAVILRYFFGFSFRWSDELARYLFIYMVFLGIPIAFREKIHASIVYFRSFLSKKVNYFLQQFIDLLIAVTTIYIAYYTIIMIRGRLGRTPSPGMKIPMSYVYIPVLICISLLLIEIIQRLFRKGYRKIDDDSNIDLEKEKYL